jgi:hypothetical protein
LGIERDAALHETEAEALRHTANMRHTRISQADIRHISQEGKQDACGLR